MGKHKTERQAIIAQCKYGEDDDLIKWYQSIPKGNRQSEVKHILRLGLGLPIPQKETVYGKLTADDIESLIEMRLKQELEKINATFDDMWKATQREIKNAMNSVDYMTPNTTYEPVEVQRVDEETLKMRRENIAKENW